MSSSISNDMINDLQIHMDIFVGNPYKHFNEWFLETMCVKKTKMKTKGKVQFAKKLFAP